MCGDCTGSCVHRASKNISLLPPALVHGKVSVEEEGPIRVHDQWGVLVVLLWFSMAVILHITVSRMGVYGHTGENDFVLGHLLVGWRHEAPGLALWVEKSGQQSLPK